MIPANRPVLGKDLDALRQTLGMLTNEAIFVFGMSITKWTELVNKKSDEPLTDPSLALLVRILDMNPDLPVLPKYPSPTEMYELLNGIKEIEPKPFALLFGSEASATYRWRRPGARVSPAVARLMYYLRLALMAAPASKRPQILQKWSEVVQKEGAARGVADVFRACAWVPRKQTKALPVRAEKPTPEEGAAPAKRVTKRVAAKSK
ncbi:MAG: hypothetical protein O9327_15035 [Polaromonas sp.]|nr:hypothetical protein [Polaromonas sp.]